MSNDKKPGFFDGLKEKAGELLEKAEEAIEGVVGEERVEKVKEVLTTDVRDIAAGVMDKVDDVVNAETLDKVKEVLTTDVRDLAAGRVNYGEAETPETEAPNPPQNP